MINFQYSEAIPHQQWAKHLKICLENIEFPSFELVAIFNNSSMAAISEDPIM